MTSFDNPVVFWFVVLSMVAVGNAPNMKLSIHTKKHMSYTKYTLPFRPEVCSQFKGVEVPLNTT